MICFRSVFENLISAYGPQGWWPGEGRFEIMLGAVLVQRTAWRNAETAIDSLKRAGLHAPEALRAADRREIERCVRSAGFFRTKAERLKGLAAFVEEHGGVDGLAAVPTDRLRDLLLDVAGIGPETADAILLYAFDRPAVVVDAYLRRLAQRLLGHEKPPSDTDLRRWTERDLNHSAALNEFHALVVVHGKRVCGRVPRCSQCGVRHFCRTGREL